MNGQSLNKAFVPLSGGATAVYNASGLAYYRHSDWLGSSRIASLATGSSRLSYDGAYAPYGENYAESGTQDRNFTGMNQDTISTGPYPLYDGLYREYHPTWGRWLNPDPAGLAAASPANPQSWNRYAYVTNNPLALTDPAGLQGGLGSDPRCSTNPQYCYGGVGGFYGGGTMGNFGYTQGTSFSSSALWDVFQTLTMPVVTTTTTWVEPAVETTYLEDDNGNFFNSENDYYVGYWSITTQQVGTAILSPSWYNGFGSSSGWMQPTIQAQPPPPLRQPATPAEKGLIQSVCVQNPDAMLPPVGEPTGDPQASDNFEPQPWYMPNKQNQIKQINPGPSAAHDLFGAAAASSDVCAKFVKSL